MTALFISFDRLDMQLVRQRPQQPKVPKSENTMISFALSWAQVFEILLMLCSARIPISLTMTSSSPCWNWPTSHLTCPLFLPQQNTFQSVQFSHCKPCLTNTPNHELSDHSCPTGFDGNTRHDPPSMHLIVMDLDSHPAPCCHASHLLSKYVLSVPSIDHLSYNSQIVV